MQKVVEMYDRNRKSKSKLKLKVECRNWELGIGNKTVDVNLFVIRSKISTIYTDSRRDSASGARCCTHIRQDRKNKNHAIICILVEDGRQD